MKLLPEREIYSVGADEEGKPSSAASPGQCCVLGFPVLRECSLLKEVSFGAK